MEAKILPLNGKYYGTEILIGDDEYDTIIKLWCSADYQPSDRWLDIHGITRKQYENNEIVTIVTWDEKSTYDTEAREECDICDSHFESQWTYELAKKVVSAINNG